MTELAGVRGEGRFVPLLGEVAAGVPLDVYEVEEQLGVPAEIWGAGKLFALRVRGRSMIEAGIHDGDYLIVEPRTAADNGRTVVAEVDGRVTVKRFFRDPDGRVRLQPANAEMLPLTVAGDRVRIVGVVAGVLRKYGFRAAASPCGAKRTDRTELPAASGASVTRTPSPALDASEVLLNAIDHHMVRWEAAMEAVRGKVSQAQLAQMAELGRELRALREWYGRTTKASLRRALLREAGSRMRRMEKYLTFRSLPFPEATLH